MIDLALSTAERIEYEATLRTTHRIRVRVHVCNRNEVELYELSTPVVLGGSVQFDADADVARSLQLTLLDRQHKLQFDSENPADGAVYADNFLGVDYGVWLPVAKRWVDVPVFFGGVTAFKRNGPVVELEGQGKEALALEPHLVVAGYTIPRNTPVREAIQNVMDRLGENKYALGMVEGKIGKQRAVTPRENPWHVCVGGSEDSNGRPKPGLMSKASGVFYLFYDGRGMLTAKKRGGPPSWVFDDELVTTQPQYAYDVLEFINHAEVRGGERKGSKKHAYGEYTLPASHPLSPTSLARNSKARNMTRFHDADSLKTDADCRQKARQLVESAAFQGVSAAFDSLVIPHLEENDTVMLKMPEYAITFPLRQFTIPLTSGDTMAVGFNKKIGRPK